MVFKKGNIPWLKGKHHSKETVEKLIKRDMDNKYALGHHHTEESKKLMSDARKRNPTAIETRFKIGHGASEEVRKKIGNAHKGVTRPPEMIERIKQRHGGKYHTDETIKKIIAKKRGVHLHFSEEHKRFLTNQLMRVRCVRPSKPQAKLFETIKNRFPNENVIMEYTIETSRGLRFIDVAVPNLKIGFEFDPPYWHTDKEKDLLRHNLIEAEGWKLTHYYDISEF